MILITQPRVGTSHNEILALQMAARALDWEVLPAPNGWRLDDELITSGKRGVPYGSQIFCETIAQQMNWKLILNSFDWLSKVPQKYLKRQVDFMTLGEAKLLTETKFIKPADDKVFAAKIYQPGELITHEVISLDTPVLVSEIVEFDLEYRCFIQNNRVLTWSNYVYYKEIAGPKHWDFVPDEIDDMPYEFVQDMLWEADDLKTVSSVIDVGHIPGKGWAIIETNQAHASGLYGCDPGQALIVMGNSCELI